MGVYGVVVHKTMQRRAGNIVVRLGWFQRALSSISECPRQFPSVVIPILNGRLFYNCCIIYLSKNVAMAIW